MSKSIGLTCQDNYGTGQKSCDAGGAMWFTIKIMAEIVVGILQVAFVGTGMNTFVRCDWQLPIGELDFAIGGLGDIYQIDQLRHISLSFSNELV